MSTWALLLIMFMVLVTIKSVSQIRSQRATNKEFIAFMSEVEEKQAHTINEGLQLAEDKYQELKTTGQIVVGEIFSFNDRVTASVEELEDVIYFLIHIEKTIFLKDEFLRGTILERNLQSKRILTSP